MKPTSDLQKLTTPRLLAYYKARRRDYYLLLNSHCCDCCGESLTYLYPNNPTYSNYKQEELNYEKYLNSIKSILASREHIHK